MYVCCVWLPGWVCVGKDGANVLFVNFGYVFLGVPIGGMGKSAEDVQARLGLFVDQVRMVPERHSAIIGHSKDSGGVGVWYGCVV